MSNSFYMGKLNDILEFKNGKAKKTNHGNIPIYGGNGVLGYCSDSNFENVLIIGRVGAYCGSVHIEESKCWISDNAIAGLPKKSSYNYYNYYLLKSLQLNNKQVGSSQPLLTQDILNNIGVQIEFDKEKQKRLVASLLAIDQKIELNNRINAELEAMAKTLYDYWFVQFDFPNEEGKPYKSSGGKMVYNSTLKREIPEGWETNTIAQVFSTSLGGTPSTHNKDYWHNADIHWISSAETTFFPIISSEQKITLKGLEHSAACLLPKGTVVISIVRYIRPSILGVDAATNQSVVGIKETDIFKSSFIYPYLCGEVPKFMALRTGAQQPHINKKVIDDNIIIIPINSVLELYYKIANPIFDKIMTVAFENKHLIELRDFLLPMLMNGQVTVK